MERVCFRFEITPGQEAIYDERHANAWPEVIEAIRTAGIRNYSGFRWGTQLVYYGECHPDRDTALRRLASEPANLKWQESMRGILSERVDMAELDAGTEVYHQD